MIYFSCGVRQMGILVEEPAMHQEFLLQYGFQNNPFGYSLFRTLVIPIQIIVYKVFGWIHQKVFIQKSIKLYQVKKCPTKKQLNE